MVKRAAAKDCRVAKAAKVEAGIAPPLKSAVPTDSLNDPLADAFGEVETLSEVARDMLIAALPYALHAQEGERDPYQDKILKLTGDVFSEVRAGRQDALRAAEQALAEFDANARALDQRLVDAKNEAVAADEARTQKQRAYEFSLDALTTKKKSVDEAKCQMDKLELDRKECNEKLANFEEVLAETWTPLKAAAFDNYRQRDAAERKYLRLFEQYGGMEDSLADVLHVVFKSKPDERGEFAKTALEAAENAHAQQLEALKHQIAVFEESPGSRGDALTAAEAAALQAQNEHDAAQEASFAAQNEWAVLQTSADGIKHDVQSLGRRREELEDDLQVARGKLDKLAEIQADLLTPAGQLGA